MFLLMIGTLAIISLRLSDHCLLTIIPIPGAPVSRPVLSVPPAQLGRTFATLESRSPDSVAQAIETRAFATRQLRSVLEGAAPGPYTTPPAVNVGWSYAKSAPKVVHPCPLFSLQVIKTDSLLYDLSTLGCCSGTTFPSRITSCPRP